MSNDKSLKTKNYPTLIGFIIWLCFLLITFLTVPNHIIFQLGTLISKTETGNILYLSIFPFLIIIINGILPSNIKAVLVFFRFKNVLPGHRVFSKLIKKDPRIESSKLFDLIGYKPITPSDQNKTWYSIYKKHESVPFIRESHRVFLLTRDMTAIAFLFIPIGISILILFKLDLGVIIKFFILSLIQFVIIALVANNYGQRFALNVLAEYSSK